MTVTARDIKDQLIQTLDAYVDDFHIDDLTQYLVMTYDLTGDNPTQNIGSIDPDVYWETVRCFSKTDWERQNGA